MRETLNVVEAMEKAHKSNPAKELAPPPCLAQLLDIVRAGVLRLYESRDFGGPYRNSHVLHASCASTSARAKPVWTVCWRPVVLALCDWPLSHSPLHAPPPVRAPLNVGRAFAHCHLFAPVGL